MATPTAASPEPFNTPSSRDIAASGANLADLLAAAGNGIRITGLVLVVENSVERSGVSGKGNKYAFVSREMQIFTGNKSVLCKHQGDPGTIFPEVRAGEVRTFKILSVRMNGTSPVFELDCAV